MACRILATLICNSASSDTIQRHTMCISNDGEVYFAGKNGKDGYNLEYQEITKLPSLNNIVSIACGDIHTLCLDRNGNVFSFGSNEFGQLGLGKRKLFSRLKHSFDSYKISLQEPQRIDLPVIKQISCGGNFSCCLSEKGEVYSFGRSDFCVSHGHGTNEDIHYPRKLNSLKNINFVVCGGYHTICKSENGTIYCWGSNADGQLGLSGLYTQTVPVEAWDWPDNVVDIKCGERFTLVLTSDQEVFSCGYNHGCVLGREVDEDCSSTLGKIEELKNIVRIECGKEHSCCIDANNDLFVFGSNGSGELGLEDVHHSVSKPIKHPSLSNIIDISKGGCSTFVKTSNNEIYAFGDNEYSQLGIKTEDDMQPTPIRVLVGNEDIWCSNINKSNAKSARN